MKLEQERPVLTYEDLEKWELLWLSKQTEPVWGGHIERGEPLKGEMLKWKRSGVIEECRSVGGKPGYRLTDKGFRALGLPLSQGLTHDR